MPEGAGALVRRARAAAQLLGERAERAPEDVVGHLLCVQAQDLRAARLALRARGRGFAAADVDAALRDGRLVRTWLVRGTLQLVRREDWAWLHALTAPRMRTASDRRLRQLGVSAAAAEEAVGVIAGALDEDERLTRDELAGRLAAEGIPVEGQATPHLLGRAAMEGVLVMDGERSFVRAPGGAAAVGDAAAPGRAAAAEDAAARDEALALLGRRYLVAHAPAEADDLAAWSGLPLRDARRALALAGDGAPPAEGSDPLPPRLLGAFDEYLLGWRDRSFAVLAEHARLVHPGGGMIRAVAVDDGLVVGTWNAGPAEEHADVARFLARS